MSDKTYHIEARADIRRAAGHFDCYHLQGSLDQVQGKNADRAEVVEI
jgi:hypothetical protein